MTVRTASGLRAIGGDRPSPPHFVHDCQADAQQRLFNLSTAGNLAPFECRSHRRVSGNNALGGLEHRERITRPDTDHAGPS